jgi:hypothetical protein
MEWSDGPNLPLRPAKLLPENEWRPQLAWSGGFQFEHARVLAGEQLPQKSTSNTERSILDFVHFVAFCG